MKVEWWCVGKTAYPSKAKALDRIKRQNKDRHRTKRKGWSGDQAMKPYRCVSCGHWHVGGTSKKTAGNGNKFGQIERYAFPRPKGYDSHGRRKSSKQGGEASLPSMHTDPEEQEGQVAKRQHQS